jgi:hypothetical protein
MAIKTAGIRTAEKSTRIKIENQSSIALPKGADEDVQKIISFIPTEHIRGLEKLRLVDFIKTPQLKGMNAPERPGKTRREGF